MKAWVCRTFTDPFSIDYIDWPSPPPEGRNVQIAIRAAGLSYGETLIIRGTHQSNPPLPYIFGTEGAGIVQACGPDVTRFKPGDEVVVHDWNMYEARGGCCAELTTAHEDRVFLKPKNISFADAASFPSNYMTTYNAFFHRTTITPGEVLVVHGATGGVGLSAVQFGKMLGATVIGTGGNDEKLAQVRKLGADHVINYNRESIRDRVLEITGGRGADVYYDPVGGEAFQASMRAIAPGGRILIIGFMSGTDYAKAATNIILVKMISIIGVEAGIFTRADPDQYRKDMEAIIGFINAGKLSPYHGKSYPMRDLKLALQDLADRKIVSKCIVENEAR